MARLWLAARLLYVPAYLVHIPFVRSLLWFVSMLALLAMLARLLNPSM